MSYFSTIDADASNSPSIRLTPRFKTCFVIVVALTDSFKTLTTCRYLFFLTLFFGIAIFASGIAVSNVIKRVANNGAGTKLSLTDFHLLN